jgi:selenocysteine lyase/cysteine desulfurase
MDLETARSLFPNQRGYLSAASMGLPPMPTLDALRADLDAWGRADCDPSRYDPIVARARATYARLVGIDASRVALGSQTSVLASVVAAAVPSGAEVLCVDGDFSSMVFPFLQRSDVHTRSVPLAELATSVGPNTWLVAFSHVQSASGAVADVAAITAAAAATGARTLCDLTQSAGVHPVDATLFDATVCHSYKWLCAPRGAALLTMSEAFQALLTPVHAGWFAGNDPWASCYGPEMLLAADARAFDVSPAWSAWVGAEVSIGLFADLDIDEVWRHSSGLGDALCDGLGIPRQGQAIVTWADADGRDYSRLSAAGVRVASRAGRLRAAFHLWNDLDDVGAALAVLR